ncbi:hypothetical protein Tco_0511361, partial [Tanacetum coccineum]
MKCCEVTDLLEVFVKLDRPGATCAMILTPAIYSKGFRLAADGMNAMDLSDKKEKAENRKKLQDLEDDILLNRPQSVIDGYNRWMSHGDYAEPYAIRVNKEIFRQADESYFAVNATKSKVGT